MLQINFFNKCAQKDICFILKVVLKFPLKKILTKRFNADCENQKYYSATIDIIDEIKLDILKSYIKIENTFECFI